MSVWVTEIYAAAAARPVVAPFDGNPARSEMRLPPFEFALADGERHMQRTIAAMTGNGPAGQGDGLARGALAKDQEDIVPGHRISRQPVVAIDRLRIVSIEAGN